MSRNKVGVPYENPLRYKGPGTDLIPIVKVSRIPTATDNRFPVGQFWLIGANPTTGTEGDLYYLCNYLAAVPQWCQVSTGAGAIGVDGLISDDGLPATVPDGMGNITIAGGTGLTTSGQDPDTTLTIDLDVPVTVPNGGTGATTLTDGGILLGSGVGAVTATAQMTDGQLLIGRTGIDPIPATLTQGVGITITEGVGSITIATTGGAAIPTTFTTDAGNAIPAANVLNVLGGTGIDTAGAGNTVTINGSAAVPLSFPTDAGTATPAANALTIAGGTGINTSGAGAIATVNLDSPVLVANGGTGRTSHTAYAVICGGTGATTAQQSIASVGTAGQALISNGAGALPTFQNIAGGAGITFLGSATAAASASLEFTTDIDATYNTYLFVFEDILASAASPVLQLRTSSDGGVSYDSNSGDYSQSYTQNFNNPGTSQTITSFYIQLSSWAGANDTMSGKCIMYSPSESTYTHFEATSMSVRNSVPIAQNAINLGSRKESDIVDAVQFSYSSGNIASGTIYMYGLTTPS